MSTVVVKPAWRAERGRRSAPKRSKKWLKSVAASLTGEWWEGPFTHRVIHSGVTNPKTYTRAATLPHMIRIILWYGRCTLIFPYQPTPFPKQVVGTFEETCFARMFCSSIGFDPRICPPLHIYNPPYDRRPSSSVAIQAESDACLIY